MRIARLAAALGFLAAGLAAPAGAQVANAPSERRIVVFRKPIGATARMRLVQQAGGEVTHDLWLINAVAVKFPPAAMQKAEAGLRAHPDVARIEEDFVQNWIKGTPATLHEAPLPDVKSFLRPLNVKPRRSQLDAEQPWGIARVAAEKAWAVTRGAGAKVGVVDTGIDYTHPDLKANVKGGWNATDPEKADDFMDDNAHGTHVAGTIAAVRDGRGVVGVAPEADLYGIKVLDAYGSGSFADVIAGMQWTADPAHKMDVVNMSLGASRGTPALADAAKALAKAGVTVVAAAGNSGGSVGYPAAYPEMIAVSASNILEEIAYFSSRGPEVAFIAPGEEVLSTVPGGGHESFSGTSMACPHGAGLAALAVSAKGVRGPEALRAALSAAAEPLARLTQEEQGAGLVNAEKLVR